MIHIDYVSLNSNPWDGNAPSLGNSWEPRKSKMAAVILVNYVLAYGQEHSGGIYLYGLNYTYMQCTCSKHAYTYNNYVATMM